MRERERESDPYMCRSCFVFFFFDQPRFVTPASKFIRRIHGIEAMRLLGWDLSCWYGDTTSTRFDTLCNMAGNAWSAWHFLPFITAVLTSVPWVEVVAEDEAMKAEKAKKEEEDKAEHEESSSDGESSRVDVSSADDGNNSD